MIGLAVALALVAQPATCIDWPRVDTGRQVVLLAPGQPKGSMLPFAIVDRQLRIAVMFSDQLKMVSVDEYGHDPVNTTEMAEAVNALIDYSFVCAFNWRIKHWQDLLPAHAVRWHGGNGSRGMLDRIPR